MVPDISGRWADLLVPSSVIVTEWVPVIVSILASIEGIAGRPDDAGGCAAVQ
jgi:hypothetical protein